MRASVSNSQDLGMPAIYLHTLAELLHTIGVDERDLILRVGLDPTRLNSTELRVSQAQASEVCSCAICGVALCDKGSQSTQPSRTWAPRYSSKGAPSRMHGP